MIILLILVFATVTGYDLKCPVKSEWRLRANVSCYLEDKYVCLFHLLKGKYEENCLGSDQSSIGSKLVFQPLFNLAKCNAERFQPIVFTTHGNSECILRKSECSEEGQVVYSNESSSIDTVCRCDYTRGYAHVSKPQNRCFCIPSEEDCSCFKVECTQLSADYQCIPDDKKMTDVNCEEIQPQMSYNRHNLTVRIIQNEIHRYSNGRLVSYIILILLAFYSIIAVITVVAIEYKDRKRKHLKSKDDEKHRFIQELFLKGECGKHHFARLIFIGKNGVGKTSLMRRLLWKNKKDVISTLSTDGIEVEKCNINITNGKWSPCDEIDDDLARLIQRVYTKKKEQEEQESERNPGEKIFVEVITNYNEEEAKTVLGNNEEVLSEKNQVDELSKATHSENEEEYNIDRLHEEEITKDDSESDEKLAIEIKEGRMHTIKLDRLQNVEMEDSNSNQTEPETRQFRHSNDISIINNEIENESGSENDEKVDKLTSNIMESCFHWNEDDPLDKQAFCWLWDFAGQKDFYATHQVFLSTCAVYLLVTDSLDFSCAEKLWVDFENSAQYVRFWFDAIHCYWSTTQKNRLDPPIIVVCTKEDTFKDQTKRKKRQMKFEDSLAKVLSSQKKKAHLRNIYFVSNTEDNDDVFEEIRKNISLHAMTMNDWGRDCPLKWLLFQQVLVKLKDGKVPISNITKLLKIARHEQIGITDYEEFTLCLQYYHNIGTIIYFDEENLKEYVILDPKWLIDAFRCLVSDKIEKVIRVSDDWLKLKEQGELTDSLISLLFEKEPNLKFSENKAHLIEVMKRFDIIVNLRNSTVFYMPCMMESCSFVNVQKQFMNQGQSFDRTSWLCLDFDFLPPAFFNHILAWYIKQYSVSVILDKRLLYLRNALYRQIGVFDLDSSGCEKLVVCEGPNIIALQVWNSRMPAQTYGDIGKHLFQFVDTLRDRYRMKIVYKKKFKCKDGDFTFDRRQIDKLFVVEYHCLEHRTTHLSDDLLKPWGFLKNIQLLREQEIAHMRH